MRQVVILDQFTGWSPYWFQQNPTPFSELVADVQARPGEYTLSYGYKPKVAEVAEDFRAPHCTTVYAADADGNTFAWCMNWDSSG